MKLKVCGMREKGNIEAVAALGPDYMGFLFYPQSPRYVGEHFVMPELNERTQRVGVFVNATTESIRAEVEKHGLSAVQLHGSEPVEQCAELKAHNVLVIKVFSVDNAFDFSRTKNYRGAVDFFLFDTKGKYHGGNARTFDWQLLNNYDQSIPFFLSGGIGPAEVEQLNDLKHMNIHAIDINSGVELSPALKNVNAIRQVQTQLRNLIQL